jgi:hypothetical protein
MSVSLAKNWYFSAIVVSERYETAVLNPYTVHTEFTTVSESNIDHNRAYGRFKYWMQEVMQDSVLIARDHPRLKTWVDTGSKVLIFPEDPVDQLVGIMLYCKLSAVVQTNMIIDQVSVTSSLDDDITYHHYSDEDRGPFNESGWWNDSGPNWQIINKKSRGKIVDLQRTLDWKDLNLEWNQESSDNRVVQADFTKK